MADAWLILSGTLVLGCGGSVLMRHAHASPMQRLIGIGVVFVIGILWALRVY